MSTLRILGLTLATTMILGCQTNAGDEASTGYNRSEDFVEGVPGGAVSEVDEMTATVTAVDPAKRSFTLQDEQGNTRTLYAPAEMQNFDQLVVGDKVLAKVGLERVVYLRQPGEIAADGAAGVLATAPLGSKPGMLVADTIEVTAMVKAIDTTLRTATLKFADGTERTVKVRPDVDMKTEYLGREVVLRITSAFAISVEPQ